MNVESFVGSVGPMVKERVLALRRQLGLTQEKLAERAGLSRSEVVKLEGGGNKARSARIREALAMACDVTIDRMSAYLSGSVPLHELLASVHSVEDESSTSDRYASRPWALSWGRKAGYPSEVLAEVATLRLQDGSGDPGAEFWIDQLRAGKARHDAGVLTGSLLRVGRQPDMDDDADNPRPRLPPKRKR
jgi:transcriptional regulator with XRE-family HTH domain